VRYPTLESGLAQPIEELGFTIPTLEQYREGGLVEMHHMYHSRTFYDPEADGYGAWRQVFRNMYSNIAPMLTAEHNRGYVGSLHSRYDPPKMPKDAVMIDYANEELERNGFIRMHNYKRNMPPKLILPEVWQSKIKRYKVNIK